MFGNTIKRFCPTCNKEVNVDVSMGFIVDDDIYYTYCKCYECNTDLSAKDRQIIAQAKKDGKSIGVIMS